jgi:hypothetical protein
MGSGEHDFQEVTRMHAVNFDPRRVLMVTVAALVLTLLVVAWLPSAVDNVRFGSGGTTAATVTTTTPAPVWATDPLASPLRAFTR